MNKLKIGLVSLGCDKNRIDSEIILSNISRDHIIENDAKNADVIIVNTCGFIEASKEESINTILEMAQYKNNYNCKVLAVTGCLTQRYGKELLELMPEIDVMLGVNDYDKLNQAIEEYFYEGNKAFYCSTDNNNVNEGKRILTTNSQTAYIRIAEGCDNFCTYCIIPKIRGKFRSRTMENIIQEANELANSNVKEIILVAQDTTCYGNDIYKEKKLHQLINEISKIEGIEWIRILYCYPEEIYEELIDVIAENPKVCKYLDIPIQHISDKILKLMGRRGRKAEIINTLKELKRRIPNIVIRTSIIVGFPGEEEEDFAELIEFVKDIKFDKLGVFKYSKEEGTPAAIMTNQIDEDVKLKREEHLMLVQMKISEEINEQKINNIFQVLVEGKEKELWYGRSYEMSPEVDGFIYFDSKEEMRIGSFVKVKINKSLQYDLIGDAYNEPC